MHVLDICLQGHSKFISESMKSLCHSFSFQGKRCCICCPSVLCPQMLNDPMARLLLVLWGGQPADHRALLSGALPWTVASASSFHMPQLLRASLPTLWLVGAAFSASSLAFSSASSLPTPPRQGPAAPSFQPRHSWITLAGLSVPH